jgi:hypothetical protein
MAKKTNIDRKGSVGLVTLFIIIVLAIAGGVWYYEKHNSSINQAPVEDIPVARSTSMTIPTSNPTNAQVASQSPVAVPMDWNQGKFLYSVPISGCFAFNYPPQISRSQNDYYYDQSGDTLQLSVNHGGPIQQIEQYAAEAGYTEKDFTTTAGLAGKEFILGNKIIRFIIPASVGSQQIMISLDFEHETGSAVTESSPLDLNNKEAIARSVVNPCASQ